MRQQTDKNGRPGDERNINKTPRNHHEEGQVQRLWQADGAGGVHAQREDHAPILRVIGQRIPFVELFLIYIKNGRFSFP